jgi:uncharacterized protein YhbP (UPF0306 family)
MNAKDLIKQYINQPIIMQLATCVNNQPWVCTVHFYADDKLNLYWVSRNDRRHSKEIKVNPKVSATILIHENTATEDWVIAVTLEGIAEVVDESIIQNVGQDYVNKTAKDPELLAKIVDGPDKFYRLIPSSIVLFDNKNFPKDPRQEWKPKPN